MSYCTSCGAPIPEGQGSSCSMCYGDPCYGNDGYYMEFLELEYENELKKQSELEALEKAMMENVGDE